MIYLASADWIFAAGVILALAIAVLLARTLRPGTRWYLGALRIGSLLLLLMSLGGLEFRRPINEGRFSQLTVLVDRSESMNAHWKVLDGVLETIERWTSREKIKVRLFGFSSAVSQELKNRGDLDAVKGQPQTRIIEALTQIRTLLGERSMVLLLSDGVETSGLGPQALNLRVHSIVFGSLSQSDLEISQVRFPQAIVARAEAPYRVSLRYPQGLRDLISIKIRDRDRGELVWQTTVTLSGVSPQTIDLVMTVPRVIGEKHWSIEASAPSWDKEVSNNKVLIDTEILREKLRVLYLCGKPSFDYVFLRELIRSQPSRELVSFVILRNPEDSPPYGESELSLIPFPAQEIFTRSLGEFDVFILQDFAFGRFGLPPAYLDQAERFARSGGGLIVMAGPSMRQSPEYARFSSEVLSLAALPQEPIKIGPMLWSIRDSSWWNERFRIYSDVSKNLDQWRGRLDSVFSSYPYRFMPPDSDHAAKSALLVANLEDSQRENGVYPAVVTREIDKGRVAWVGFSGSWTWKSRGGSMASGAEFYDVFWENLLLWASGDDSQGFSPKVYAHRQNDGQWRLTAKLKAPSQGPLTMELLPGHERVLLVENIPGSGIYEGSSAASDIGAPQRARLSQMGKVIDVEVVLAGDKNQGDEFRMARDEAFLNALTAANGGVVMGQADEWAQNVPQAYRQRLLEDLAQAQNSSDFLSSEGLRGGRDLSMVTAVLAACLLLAEWVWRRLRGLGA